MQTWNETFPKPSQQMTESWDGTKRKTDTTQIEQLKGSEYTTKIPCKQEGGRYR